MAYEILSLIESDAVAKKIADDRTDDEALAARLREIAPPQYEERLLTELGIYNIYPNPADAEKVLQTFEAVAEVNPFVKRLVKWLQPGAIGVNFGDPRVKAALTAPVESGGLGMSAELAGPLLDAGRVQPNITAAHVGAALLSKREKR